MRECRIPGLTLLQEGTEETEKAKQKMEKQKIEMEGGESGG